MWLKSHNKAGIQGLFFVCNIGIAGKENKIGTIDTVSLLGGADLFGLVSIVPVVGPAAVQCT